MIIESFPVRYLASDLKTFKWFEGAKRNYTKNFTGNTFLIGQSNCTVHYILPENNLYPPTN